MKRRNFFALLFAPILARFAPKPVITLGLSARNGPVGPAITQDYINRVTAFLLEDTYFSKYGFISEPVTGGTYLQESITYGQAQDHHQA